MTHYHNKVEKVVNDIKPRKKDIDLTDILCYYCDNNFMWGMMNENI